MLISPAYLEQQRALHATGKYGSPFVGQKADIVREAALWGRRRILDYGCGKQTLAEALGPAYRVTGYDPCIPGLDARPEPHPVVVSSDVLEHIEPECLDAVLRDLRRVTQYRALLFVSCVEAEKTLADGRNAHLIQQPKEWWLERLRDAGLHALRSGDGVNNQGRLVGFWAEAVPC